ncbi:uncharacterized protein METZ01_LOCUS247790, partial [marine metagenome]
VLVCGIKLVWYGEVGPFSGISWFEEDYSL